VKHKLGRELGSPGPKTNAQAITSSHGNLICSNIYWNDLGYSFWVLGRVSALYWMLADAKADTLFNRFLNSKFEHSDFNRFLSSKFEHKIKPHSHFCTCTKQYALTRIA